MTFLPMTLRKKLKLLCSADFDISMRELENSPERVVSSISVMFIFKKFGENSKGGLDDLVGEIVFGMMQRRMLLACADAEKCSGTFL